MFSVQRQSGAVVKTSMKLRNRNGCGQRSDESACSVVISDVSTMKTNGARNAIATAINTLWFAIEISSRFRRTAAGGRRRTIVAGPAAAVIAEPPGAPTCAS